MDLFQRLLGTLQRTVDYISTFTTYLLGDEAHPGAENSGSTRETGPHRSRHDCDVETAHYGDISPRDDLNASERLPIAEAIPPNQENQEAPGKDISSAQVTEAIPRSSKLLCRDEGQENVDQKLSDPLYFLADAPQTRSSTTGSRDLEKPVVTGGLYQWEAEGSTGMGAIQQEETADMKARSPEKSLAGGQEHEELGRAGEVEEAWQEEQKETEGGVREAPGVAGSDCKEQKGLDGAAWMVGFQQQEAKMVEGLGSEPGGGLAGGANMEDNQQEELDIEVGVEVVQPGSVETGDDQQGEPGEAESRNHPQWKPEEEVILEVQEENPKGATGEYGQQRGLEGSETKNPWLGEIEGFVRNEGTRWREQEENEGDGGEESVVDAQGGDGTGWTGRCQQEVAKMAEDLRAEPIGQLPGGTNMEDNQLEDIETGDEGGQTVRVERQCGGVQEGGPEGGAEARSHLPWEPEERVTLEVQEKNLKGVTEEGDGQQRGLEEVEMEACQQGEREGFVRNGCAQWKEQEENVGDAQEATGREEFVMEEQKGEGTAWTGRSQRAVDKMAEGQCLEVESQNNQQGEPDLETGDEGAQQTILEDAETRDHQQRGPEREGEARNIPPWEPEEIVTLEVQEEDPKGITEKGGNQQRGLEEAETEESQPREIGGFVRNEDTPWKEQEENEGDEREATCGERQSGDAGTAWTGRSQQELAKMADSKRSEAEGQLLGREKAENNQQGEPDVETGDEGSGGDGAEAGGDQEGGQGEAEVGKNLCQELEKTVTLEECPEEGNGQQKGLEGAEEREGHRHGKLEGLNRNGAEDEEEGPEEQMGEPRGLEREQQKDPPALAGIIALEEVVVAEVTQEPEVQGQETREIEGTKRRLPTEALGDKATFDTCCLAGAGAFPGEVPSLDTSAQKERVLLRRKSSIRRAPSLKRPRPPTETPPPEETGIEETPPSQPPSSGRPSPRHAGFGPMHPNMMAELQMRLRKPQ